MSRLMSVVCALAGGIVVASCVTGPAATTARAEHAAPEVSTDAPSSPVTIRNGKPYVIERFDKEFAAFDQPPGWVRPRREVNVAREIVREDDRWVWVWTPVASAPTAAAVSSTASPTDVAAFAQLARAFDTIEPAATARVVRFEESSRGLPTMGSWRNGLAVADMNEDGLPDLIAPPQRGEIDGTPHVFLQNGDGSWREWDSVVWPRSLDYGSVVAADFDRDGHVDLALAAHLQGIALFRGDGRGHFAEEDGNGLPNDFPTRRLIVADVDRDGWPDLVASSEGPGALRRPRPAERRGLLRAYRNARGQPWSLIDISGSIPVAGDWLTSGDFNGDRAADFATSNIYFNSQQNLFVSDGSGAWRESGRELLAPYSYTFAVEAGRFRSASDADDAILTYGRAWPTSAAPQEVAPPGAASVVGIDRVSWSGGRPRIEAIARWASDRPVWALGSGDFDGNGTLDLAFVRSDPAALVVLLNDGHGNFRRCVVEGVAIPPNATYDLRVADIDRDGRPDIVLMFESGTSLPERNGSIRVYLDRTR